MSFAAIFLQAHMGEGETAGNLSGADENFSADAGTGSDFSTTPSTEEALLLEMTASVAMGKIPVGILNLRISEEQLFAYMRRR